MLEARWSEFQRQSVLPGVGGAFLQRGGGESGERREHWKGTERTQDLITLKHCVNSAGLVTLHAL